jgi:hypothetical protein
MPGQTEDGEWVTGLTVGRDLQLSIPRAEVMLKEQERLELVEAVDEIAADEFIPPAVEVDPVDAAEASLVDEHTEQEWEDLQTESVAPVEVRPAFMTPGMRGTRMETPIPDQELFNGAERIEIWVDEETRWWWRAIDEHGHILKKDSGINEAGVIGAAHFFYPGAPVHQVQREVDDSRNLRQYGVPGRMWDRG